MEDLKAIRKRWKKINIGMIVIYAILSITTAASFFLIPESTAKKEMFEVLRDFFKLLIFFFIAYQCAYKNDGYRFIMFYFIVQIISLLTIAALMILTVNEYVVSNFSDGITKGGIIVSFGLILIYSIIMTLHYLCAKWSYKLFKVNKALKKARKEKEKPLPAQ